MIDSLRTHPVLGMAASFSGPLIGFMETVSPYLRFVSVVIGLAIGALTLYLKVKEWRSVK